MSYLADVEMPASAQPEIDDLELREDVDISELDYGEDKEFIDDDDEELSPLPPPPQKKDKIKSEDIFKPKQAPPKKVKVADRQTTEEPIIPTIAPIKEKKKRVLSEKQKEALAKGRAKRAANKKAPSPSVSLPTPVPTPVPTPRSVPTAPVTQKYIKENHYDKELSDEKLQELIFQGVQRYDSMRKERKAKKREAQAQQTHDKKVFSDINSALNRTVDPWASAFNF